MKLEPTKQTHTANHTQNNGNKKVKKEFNPESDQVTQNIFDTLSEDELNHLNLDKFTMALMHGEDSFYRIDKNKDGIFQAAELNNPKNKDEDDCFYENKYMNKNKNNTFENTSFTDYVVNMYRDSIKKND
ncbi:MAG: hypothetical protein LKG27_04390 [Clostridiaceae bacterium]|jgi:hypothetical protein|nr:hypothetical protein [Clostridiaceae bacterium]